MFEEFQDDFEDDLDFANPTDDDLVEAETSDPFDVLCQAKTTELIEKHFETRSFHCGGPIPKKSLMSNQNVKLVRECDFHLGIDAAYEILESRSIPDQYEDDVEYLITIFNELATVPKEVKIGMLLLSLKYCYGYELPEDINLLTKRICMI